MLKKQKTATNDFSISDLPSTRKELFFDILKGRYYYLLTIGCVLLLFILPLVISYTLKDLAINNAYLSYQEKIIDESVLKGYLLTINLGYDLINIILYSLFAVGISGVTRIFKRLIWNEGVIFISDWIDGVKMNVKSYLGLFFMTGLVIMLNNSMVVLFENTEMDFMRFLPWGITLIILLPIGLFSFSQIIYYQNSFIRNLNNGTRLYISSPLNTIIMTMTFVLSSLPFILLNYILIRFIIILLWTLLVLPLLMCGWILYSNSLFDKHINSNQFPEIVNKGLYIDIKKDKE